MTAPGRREIEEKLIRGDYLLAAVAILEGGVAGLSPPILVVWSGALGPRNW